MKPELTLKLKPTTRAEFATAIISLLDEYINEAQLQNRKLSNIDEQAIDYIRKYIESGISGESLRANLKIIMRDFYGRIGRFFYDLPKRIEALRNRENFSAAKLRWGDSPDILLKSQLAASQAHNHQLTEENQQISTALRETMQDYTAALEEIETLKSENYELRELIKKSGFILPASLSSTVVDEKPSIEEKEKKEKLSLWSDQQPGRTLSIFKLNPAHDSKIEALPVRLSDSPASLIVATR